MEVSQIIAYNLKKLRGERNLSLGQLAEKAGVSKVVLSQIERGDANPTINTLWKITGALELPYTSLLERPPAVTEQVRKGEIPELQEKGYHIFHYYSKNEYRNFEMYQIEVEPGCDHPSIGHSSRSYEYVMIIQGEMTLTACGQEHVLAKDDALCFDASGAHSYRNDGGDVARAVLLIQYI